MAYAHRYLHYTALSPLVTISLPEEATLQALLVLGALAVDWLTLDSFALAAPWLALAWIPRSDTLLAR